MPVRRNAVVFGQISCVASVFVRPVKSGEELAVYIDVNPARGILGFGIHGPSGYLYEGLIFRRDYKRLILLIYIDPRYGLHLRQGRRGYRRELGERRG